MQSHNTAKDLMSCLGEQPRS